MCEREAEMLAKIERVKEKCHHATQTLQSWIALNGGPLNNLYNEGKDAGIQLTLDYLRKEFPDV